jgi:putative methionine-R-sulfoxide reductase with GAF domain
MIAQPHQTDTVSQAQSRVASRSALLMLAAAAVYDLFVFFLAFQSGAWQLWLHAIQMAAFCAVMLISAGLSRGGRVGWGIGLQLVFLWVTVLIISALFAGMGITMALIGLFLTLGIASQTLAQKFGGRIILAGVGVALGTLLVDLVGQQAFRLEAPALQLGASIAAGGLFLVYAAFAGRRFGNYSLRTKLIVALVSLTALTVGVLAFLNDRASRANLTASVGADLKNLAQSQALAISDSLVARTETLRALALSKVLQDRAEGVSQGATGDEAELKRLDQQWQAALANNRSDPLVQEVLGEGIASELRKFQQTFPENVEIFLTDKYGATIAATNPPSDYYQGDEGWWRAAYNDGLGAIHIGQLKFDESKAAVVGLIAVPVYAHGSQEVVGVLHTTYKTEKLAESLKKIKVGETGSVELYLPTGQELDDEKIEPIEIDLQSLAKFRVLRIASYAEAAYGGKPSLVSYAPVVAPGTAPENAIANLSWSVIVHQDLQESLAPVEAQTRTTQVLALAILGVGVATALGLAQILAAPIVQLTAVAERVAAGDLGARAEATAQDEVGQLAKTFNGMTAQLRETLSTLERRVQERTQALAATAEISRRLSTLLDRKQLVTEVVEQLQSAFNYYYSQIYLYDESRQDLVLVSGSGETGRVLVSHGHKLREGRGLVGKAASTNTVMLASNVSQNPDWLPNPLLPYTKSEIAVPIAVGGRVLGVLDVQHNAVGGLEHEDAELLQSIANQVGIALQNAEAVEQTRRRAELEGWVNTINQKIQRANSIENVLQIAVGELGQALGASRASAQVSMRRRLGGAGNGHRNE